MKKAVVLLFALTLLAPPQLAYARERDRDRREETCVKIKDGILRTSDGELIVLGFDRWGYNYQSHIFKGFPINANRQGEPVTDGDVKVIIRWNDAFLSNKDCDGDGILDVHFGHDSYIGSWAWLSNRFYGTYEGADGRTHHWWHFILIAAKPDEGFSCEEHHMTDIGGGFCQVIDKFHDPYGGYTADQLPFVDPGIISPNPVPGPDRDGNRVPLIRPVF